MAAISSLSGILNQYVISSGNTRIIALIQTIGLCLTIIFGFILIPIYSSVGLILAQSLATVFTFIAYIKPALSDLSSVDKKAFWFLSTINLILIITSLTLSIMFNNYLIKSIVSISIICIAAILVLTKGFTSEEKSLVFSYIHKPFN
jgi:O-antigen/teichoic acid export membrane protein